MFWCLKPKYLPPDYILTILSTFIYSHRFSEEKARKLTGQSAQWLLKFIINHVLTQWCEGQCWNIYTKPSSTSESRQFIEFDATAWQWLVCSTLKLHQYAKWVTEMHCSYSLDYAAFSRTFCVLISATFYFKGQLEEGRGGRCPGYHR